MCTVPPARSTSCFANSTVEASRMALRSRPPGRGSRVGGQGPHDRCGVGGTSRGHGSSALSPSPVPGPVRSCRSWRRRRPVLERFKPHRRPSDNAERAVTMNVRLGVGAVEVGDPCRPAGVRDALRASTNPSHVAPWAMLPVPAEPPEMNPPMLLCTVENIQSCWPLGCGAARAAPSASPPRLLCGHQPPR